MINYKAKEICKGCPIGQSSRSWCNFQKTKQEELCPCLECLVKVTCSRECEERANIYRKHVKPRLNSWGEVI